MFLGNLIKRSDFDFSIYLKPYITANDFRAKLRFPRAVGEPPRRDVPAGRKAEGLCSEAGGIRRIGHEGVLCLLGRVGL
jgi:hypothetical protein